MKGVSKLRRLGRERGRGGGKKKIDGEWKRKRYRWYLGAVFNRLNGGSFTGI